MTRDLHEASDDSFKSYELALREMRLRRIRSGIYQPRQHDSEEMAAHLEWQRMREREDAR